MGDYTNMSTYYDLIMQSGYYDYEKIVDHLIKFKPFKNVLEIGCGTGLILEELSKREADLEIVGFDLTAAMLEIANKRLESFSNIELLVQNVTTLHLNKRFDLAFSYGGVWYFVVDGINEPFLVSHIAENEPNRLGMEQISQHVVSGGRLLLGIQGPHHDYESLISNGMVYSQKIEPHSTGFTKHYFLADGPTRLMSQTIEYRTYSFDDALKFLEAHGFSHDPVHSGQQFMAFTKS